MEIVISGVDEKRIKLIETMAKELGLSIKRKLKESEQLSDKERAEELFQLMEEMAEQNLFNKIKDPVAWQREQRKDRILPGRD